ncbi:MAG: PQQ-binding-like beta-propeller repeat protein [Verrucomicrobiota bacterium]
MRPSSHLIAPILLTSLLPLHAEDWPMWGRSADRNMVGNAKNLPVEVEVGEIGDDEQVDLATAKNVLWAAKLGSQTYGNTVVADGKVYVGTNNESPRDPKQTGDRGNMMVFDEKTGKFLWQLIIPKLGAGKVSDWEYVGLCSSPIVEGKKAWLITNRGEVICLDTEGMTNGNDGPYKDEANYMSADGTPVEVGSEHADILWIYDMREELGIFPHNVSSNSPVIVDGILYTGTSNGVDWSHTNIPAPLAPSLVALDAEKGTLVGEDLSGVSERVLHASWSSPAFGKLGGKDRVVWGGGDGFAYAFEPKPVFDEDEELDVLKQVWSYDANPPEYRNKKDGEPIKYATFKGPSEIIGTTVVHKDRVYAVIGQDPEHGDGVGMLTCLDASGKPIWTFKDIGRSISTPSVHDGLIYMAEYDGDLHCIDIQNGNPLWKHETMSRIWGSTLVADGKVFLPTEDGELHILAADREKKELGVIAFDAPIYSSPIVANDVLYIATMTHLYAIGSK